MKINEKSLLERIEELEKNVESLQKISVLYKIDQDLVAHYQSLANLPELIKNNLNE